eukprot:GFYU01006509.1.p1 GENE.GFYU01006509.1~~GFYU01006509.1.p1  ORF type:complete len:195 (-),score=34.92 GFYU01006509.1:226-810(-)
MTKFDTPLFLKRKLSEGILFDNHAKKHCVIDSTFAKLQVEPRDQQPQHQHTVQQHFQFTAMSTSDGIDAMNVDAGGDGGGDMMMMMPPTATFQAPGRWPRTISPEEQVAYATHFGHRAQPELSQQPGGVTNTLVTCPHGCGLSFWIYNAAHHDLVCGEKIVYDREQCGFVKRKHVQTEGEITMATKAGDLMYIE